MESRLRAREAADPLLIVIFLAFIILPLLGTLFGWDLYEVQENRRPAPPPDPRTSALEELPAAFDAYYRDRFGFRNFFIRRWNRLQRRLDKGLLRQVILGRDNWLFYDRPDVILDYLGRGQTTEEDLDHWLRALEGRHAWLAERGIRYLFGVAPNKPSIYPEMLPDELRARGGTTRLDLLMAYMERSSSVRVLDLRPVLRSRKDWRPLYLSNDTHWNAAGAYLAYGAVVDRLREWFPALEPPLDIAACTVETHAYYGDLARFADLPRAEFTIPIEKIEPPAQEGFESATLEASEFAPDRLWPVDHQPPPVYRSPRGHGRAVVFQDSFFVTTTRLLAEHFEESTFLWLELTPEALRCAVERQRPDVVIEVIAERVLYRLPESSEEWEEARRRAHAAGTLGRGGEK